MPRSHENFNRVVVTGVDGSGKSTAAHESARLLSQAYPSSDIRVVDSTGLSHYQGGEITLSRFAGLEKIEPAQKASKIETVTRMAGFTAARQFIQFGWSHKPNSLTIGVRVLNALTMAAHPAVVALLKVDVDQAYNNAAVREFVNTHETPEKIIQAAQEFPRVLETYHQAYDVPSVEINALKPNSADLLDETFEVFIPTAPKK